MHPSKAHPSTTKEADAVLRSMDVDPRTPNQRSGLRQESPSKTDSTYGFRVARPGPNLGPEAQRVMDELREEAMKIKVKLAAEREEENRKESSSKHVTIEGRRKIAQPKGKVGRFSDIHMAEFKKMDSIARHPSSFRAQPNRFALAAKTLKRSQSKAKLDDREFVNEDSADFPGGQVAGLESLTPAKRARKTITDDISTTRPVSQDGSYAGNPLPSTPTFSRSQSALLSAITTPTQASLARAANIKHSGRVVPDSSGPPPKLNQRGTPRSLTKSATTNTLTNLPRSASQSLLASSGKFARVKSILRYPGSSKKPAATASLIPALTRSASKPNLEKALPSTPSIPRLKHAMSMKHVNFTSDTIHKQTAKMQYSPSPVKSGLPRSASKTGFGTPQRSNIQSGATDVQYPSVTSHSSIVERPFEAKYPSLASPYRPLPEPPRLVKSEPRPPPSIPSRFNFRSDHTISFGTSPEGFGSSPGQSGVRQVRQSIAPNTMPGSFPDCNKENLEAVLSIHHGISNKKRCRVDSDNEEEDAERYHKKHKPNAAESPMLMAPRIMAEKIAPKSRIPSPVKKKRVLSLSRLNMLARPKMRK
jgi:hypothetical protein